MRNKKLVKMLAMALATTTFLTACGGNAGGTSSNGGGSNGGDAAASGEMQEINVMVYDRALEFAPGNTVTDNALTRWVNEQLEPLGVHANYIPVPRSGADNAVNLMLAGGTAPDIIVTNDLDRVKTYSSQGGLFDLADYVDRLDSDYTSKYADAIESLNFDGKQASVPRVFEIYGKAHDSFIRKDLVEAAGKEMPTTPAELVDVLYAIHEQNPSMVGFGMVGGPRDQDWANFVLSYTSRADERDNYIYEPSFTRYLKPGHEDALKQLNQMWLDGVISQHFLEDTENTQWTQDIANGNMVYYAGNQVGFQAYSTAQDPNYEMVMFEPWEDVDGSREVPGSGRISQYVYVPAASADKIDGIMTYLNFLSQRQNAIDLSYQTGIGGSTMSEDGYPISKTPEELRELGSPGTNGDMNIMITGFDFGMSFNIANILAGAPDTPQDVAEEAAAMRNENIVDYKVIPAILPSDQYVPLLQTLICEFVYKVINAPEGQFDQVYETEYQILLDNHLQDVLDDRAEWYDANH